MSKAILTVRIDSDTLERARDMAWTDRVTLASVVENAILEHIAQREALAPVPKRTGELRPGRSVQ